MFVAATAAAARAAARRAAPAYVPRRALSAVAAFPELDAPHPRNNVPASIAAVVRGRKLLRTPHHPLAALKERIFAHFDATELPSTTARAPAGAFAAFEAALPPVVTVRANFDELLTPLAHASRRASDTFYVDDARVLRCHMTAHQPELLRAGHARFLMAGDVYRRDTVDATHAPVFHQLDGVRVWAPAELPAAARAALAAGDAAPATALAAADLRATLEGLARTLFGARAATRWVPAHFPFTEPSMELEVDFGGRWLEVLGAGVVRAPILASATGGAAAVGWAFGLGLERLAMVLHAVPDIRLFWSKDPRFIAQFARAAAPPARAGAGAAVATPPAEPPPVTFEPFSRYPACYKDVAFWVPAGTRVDGDGDGVDAAGCVAEPAAGAAPARVFHENDFHAAVREAAGDLVEAVERIDRFAHPKTGRTSLCFRILYRSAERSLTNDEVDAVQEGVKAAVARMGFELR